MNFIKRMQEINARKAELRSMLQGTDEVNLDEIEKELPDLVIAKVNVDELTSVAIKYGIQSIPTLIVMQNGEVVNKAVGFRTKEQIIDLLK